MEPRNIVVDLTGDEVQMDEVGRNCNMELLTKVHELNASFSAEHPFRRDCNDVSRAYEYRYCDHIDTAMAVSFQGFLTKLLLDNSVPH